MEENYRKELEKMKMTWREVKTLAKNGKEWKEFVGSSKLRSESRGLKPKEKEE